MTTVDLWRREKHSAVTRFRRAMPAAGASYRLSAALAAVSAAAALFTYFTPGILSGPAAMNGSARGTALVVFGPAPARLLEGTGLTTWLPLTAVAGVWLWQRRPWGYLIAGSMLTMWVLESIGVAVDQWYGHTADPSSPVVSAGMVWVFAALAAIGCVPIYYFYRRLGK